MAHDAVLDDAVRRATAAVQTVAESPRNDMSGAAVAGAQPQLAAAITTAIAPVIKNATNSEDHFWQKRTFWSALAAAAAGITPAVNAFLDYMNGHVVDGKVTAITIIFAAWAGYSAARAGIATTPLGTKPANPVVYRG